MKRNSVLIAALLLAGLTWTGCQKPPVMEMTAAQNALSAVDQAIAQQYASIDLDEATSALDAANAEVEAQGERFALSRNYDKAKELLTQATEKATAAQEAAVAAQAQARTDAENALAELQSTVEEARADLAALAECPKKPKDFATDLQALSDSLDALAAELGPIESAVAGEDYREASSAADSLSSPLSTLRGDLQSAREKLGC
jgi:chromosome segregation ATPase